MRCRSADFPVRSHPRSDRSFPSNQSTRKFDRCCGLESPRSGSLCLVGSFLLLVFNLFRTAILKSIVFLTTFWPISFYKALPYSIFHFAYLEYFAVKVRSVQSVINKVQRFQPKLGCGSAALSGPRFELPFPFPAVPVFRGLQFPGQHG